MTTVRKSSRNTGRKYQSTGTSESVADITWKPLTLSAAGSPANLFPWRKTGKLKPILAGSGRNSPALSVSYNPATSSWRTSPDSTQPGVAKSSLILPRAGMMRNGTIYLRRPLVPRTSVIESSLWRTPSAQLAGENKEYLASLRDKYGGLPRKGRRVYNPKDGKHIILTLNRQVKLWPTPTTGDHKDTGDSVSLGRVPVNSLLGRAVGPTKAGGSLNPTWVEWLMGFPLGWTDLEDSETP